MLDTQWYKERKALQGARNTLGMGKSMMYNKLKAKEAINRVDELEEIPRVERAFKLMMAYVEELEERIDQLENDLCNSRKDGGY